MVEGGGSRGFPWGDGLLCVSCSRKWKNKKNRKIEGVEIGRRF